MEGGAGLDSQVAWPRSDAAALAGSAKSPRVHARRHRRLMHLHPGGGDAIFLPLFPPSAPAARVGG